MALERFDPEVRHMVIFEVLSGDSFVGDKGVWNHQICLDVEDSISFANGYENFLKLMELKGYEIRQKN